MITKVIMRPRMMKMKTLAKSNNKDVHLSIGKVISAAGPTAALLQSKRPRLAGRGKTSYPALARTLVHVFTMVKYEDLPG
jgi:hypothetical protein